MRLDVSQALRVRTGDSWTVVDHASPLSALEIMELRQQGAGLGDDTLTRQRDVWKTLVRYVWHNAKNVSEACLMFGLAAVHVDARWLEKMTDEERKVIRQYEPGKGKRRVQRVLHFVEAAVYRESVWMSLPGYTPMAALLQGEGFEWEHTPEEQAARRAALQTILRASWVDIKRRKDNTRKEEKSLRAAFSNFTLLAAEDRSLLAWVTQTEFAVAFDQTRAAVCARHKRRVRAVLMQAGSKGLTAPGGKSEAAIKAYSDVQQGNTNRRGVNGSASASGDEDLDATQEREKERKQMMDDHAGVPIRPDLPKDPRSLRKHLKRLADEAEARRLALLCGVPVGVVELSKTRPKDYR